VYHRLIYPVLQRVNAERTHDATLKLLGVVERAPRLRGLIGRLLAFDDPRLHVDCLSLHFKNPLGIAAGLDKNAIAVRTWGALGFGHVEVGTVTPLPQPGNPRPRVFRLPQDQALINRMGFPGSGVATVASRLKRLGSDRPIVGLNVGANKASVEAGRAVADYLRAIEQAHAYADYITINVSSPNTAQLRDLQGKAALRALIEELVAYRTTLSIYKPLLLKIAPDLTTGELADIVNVCLTSDVDGIIATNTTIARPASLQSSARAEAGGLSGAPLRERSTEVISTLYQMSEGQLPIIGVGGVFGAADVWAKLMAGAHLVQLYTGLIYEGPLLAYRINRELIQLMSWHGVRSIGEVVGSGVTMSRT
jgi:dihydroorotate dehydrogenase